MRSNLLKAALALAKRGIPSFPTQDKKPCWSNAELGVGRGEGGYKAASCDPAVLAKLFAHERATELAVPMGEMSGLMCIDCDIYKDPALRKWVDEQEWLHDTLQHETRSGGMHFFFKHPGPSIRFPATLRPGVDIKAAGNGYVCFPPTEGYTVEHDAEVQDFPLDVLRDAMKLKGGSGSLTAGSSWNDATDEELIERIKTASDLYPALRTLSYRLPSRRREDGSYYSRDEQLEILNGVMAMSEASASGHARHHDWLDRVTKIEDLVDSSIAKNGSIFDVSEEDAAAVMTGKPLFTVQPARPIGPQRETTAKDIEARVAGKSKSPTGVVSEPSSFVDFCVDELLATPLPAISWVIPNMLPEGGICSLAGTSNVGKTRWLALLVACLSAGKTSLMGLPDGITCGTLWIANEEHTDDIKRRVKAAARRYGLQSKVRISVRPKTKGTFRLVAMNEVGTLEIDEDNVAEVVAEIRRTGARVLILDPYVTLSDASDENSAASAAMITKAFLLITSLTGVTIIHAHHTPKDRSKDEDWPRGDASAWRGSGAIYSSLDCGFTLANWFPKNGERRKAWRQNYLEGRLSRWVVLDTGKIREGQALDPVVYELTGEALPEGFDVGVCSLSSAANAENSLLHLGDDAYVASDIGEAIYLALGAGKHSPTKVHAAMRLCPLWVSDAEVINERHYPRLLELFQGGVRCESATVKLTFNEHKKTTGRYVFEVSELTVGGDHADD